MSILNDIKKIVSDVTANRSGPTNTTVPKGPAPDITYNPNLSTNPPYSTHDLASAQASTRGPGIFGANPANLPLGMSSPAFLDGTALDVDKAQAHNNAATLYNHYMTQQPAHLQQFLPMHPIQQPNYPPEAPLPIYTGQE